MMSGVKVNGQWRAVKVGSPFDLSFDFSGRVCLSVKVSFPGIKVIFPGSRLIVPSVSSPASVRPVELSRRYVG